MLDIAWPEILVIGAVALVAIGPKDLPKVMHNVGRWAGKARRMVNELQRGFEQLSYETEVAERLKQTEAEASQPVTPSMSAADTSTPHSTTHNEHDRPPNP